MFNSAGPDLFTFMKEKNASHYQRLVGYGLEEDIKYCLHINSANILPVYNNGVLRC